MRALRVTDLTYIPAVTSLTELSVEMNDALASLTGLDNLTSVGSWLSFYANTSLPPCEISALEARLGTTCSSCGENNGEGTCGE
jgi:hypothetical protein